MATEFGVQTFVHKLEEGGWAKWVRFAVLLSVLAFVYYRFLFTDGSPGSFRGLSSATGMDQAQIAREIARGNGFSTKMIRPIAIEQFRLNKGGFPVGNVPDTYHAPLNPFVNSIFLRMWKSHWEMTTKDIVYTCDRVIAGVSMVFFLLSVAVSYLTAKRLFDRRLAVLGMGLVLASDTFWKFSMSGLPQMLMLLIFSLCCYTLVRAIEAYYEDKRAVPWIALSGGVFGLLALTHGLTIWIFIGALIFVSILFGTLKNARPGSAQGGFPAFLLRASKYGAIMLAVFLLVYSPWLARNYKVSGSPFGIAPFSGLYQIRGSVGEIMRTQKLSATGVNPVNYRFKLIRQTTQQIGDLYSHLGGILVAPLFFLALLHIFKAQTASVFRWGLLLMWAFALIGMGVFGMETTSFDSNDLHILFAPMMTFYGMALVLTMWTRLEINISLVRRSFLALIYVLTGLPLVSTLFGKSEGRVQWPPYVPPFISILGEWVGVERPDEIICTDMPWGVAWYADRRSLWLPMTVNDFIALNDNLILHGRIVGLYLTPVTGDAPFISDIVKGEYKDWYPWIIRNVQVRDFPLRSVTALPIDNECVFYCDRDRWATRTD